MLTFFLHLLRYHMVFCPYSINMVYYIDWYLLNQPHIPALNPTWSQCITAFMCCWIEFASNLLTFASTFIRDWSVIFFPCDIFFVWLWYENNTRLHPSWNTSTWNLGNQLFLLSLLPHWLLLNLLCGFLFSPTAECFNVPGFRLWLSSLFLAPFIP